MQPGRVVATLAFSGEEKLAINLPGTGSNAVTAACCLLNAPHRRCFL